MEAKMNSSLFKIVASVMMAFFLLTGFDKNDKTLTKNPIQIGVYLPLTGQNAFAGQLELDGINLAFKKTHRVLGRDIALVVIDNKSDPAAAASAVKQLIEQDKVVAIIGTYGSSLAIAGGQVAEEAKVPVVGTSCSNPLVTQDKNYYFRACFIDPHQMAGAAAYALNTLKAKKPPRSLMLPMITLWV